MTSMPNLDSALLRTAPVSIQDWLFRYVRERNIAMPVYTDGSKITEEADELREALRAYLSEPSLENQTALKEEVADVIIVAAVAAYQANFTAEEALAWKTSKDRGRGVSKPSVP